MRQQFQSRSKGERLNHLRKLPLALIGEGFFHAQNYTSTRPTSLLRKLSGNFKIPTQTIFVQHKLFGARVEMRLRKTGYAWAIGRCLLYYKVDILRLTHDPL
jgi:hypothetical protein